jgi:hypothetical protein
MQVITLTPAERIQAEAIRSQRAAAQAGDYELTQLPSGRYRVARNGAAYYTTEHSCTCPDHLHRGVACKHQHLVRAAEAQRQAVLDAANEEHALRVNRADFERQVQRDFPCF